MSPQEIQTNANIRGTHISNEFERRLLYASYEPKKEYL